MPTAASASPASPAEEATSRENAAPSDSSLAQAESLYLEGRTSFETADYLRAIELWTEAYGLVSDLPENATIKAALIYNIASAQEKAYDIDRDIAHLRQADVLMQRYATSIPALYGDTAEANAELDKVNLRIEELQARIEKAEAEQPQDPPVPVEPPDDTPPPRDPAKPSKPFIIAGAVTAGLGLAGLGVMAAGLAMGGSANDIDDLDAMDIEGRRERFDRGRRGNTLAIVGGSVGGALLVGGAVLLSIGLKRRRSSNLALSPTFTLSQGASPSDMGVQLRGRF